jgi:rhodanese-related sulfurtransferase
MTTITSFKSAILVAVLTPAAFIFTGCSTNQVRNVDSKGPQSLNTSGINSQDWANAADQLVGSLLASGAPLIDVGLPSEFSEAHLHGARNIPLDELELRALEIGRPGIGVVICGGGAFRRMRAVFALRRRGFEATNAGITSYSTSEGPK